MISASDHGQAAAHFVDPDLILLRRVPVSLSSIPFLKPPGHELAQRPSRSELSPQPIQIPTRWWPIIVVPLTEVPPLLCLQDCVGTVYEMELHPPQVEAFL